MLAAFSEVEGALRETLDAAGLDIVAPGRQSVRQLVDQAVSARVISAQTADAVRNLTVLRNLAAYGGGAEIDAAKATEFLALARSVVSVLEGVRHDRPETPSPNA